MLQLEFLGYINWLTGLHQYTTIYPGVQISNMVQEVTRIFRNDGYSSTPTKSDIRFGHRVVPVDNVTELGKTGGQGLLLRDQVFLNGVILRNKTFRKRIKTREGDVVRTRFVTVSQKRYTEELFPGEYRVEIEGEFPGGTVLAETEDYESIRHLVKVSEGSALYLRGPLGKDGSIKAEELNSALVP